MSNKQPAAFLVDYLEKLISNFIYSRSSLECDFRVLNTLLCDFIETSDLPQHLHSTISDLLIQKYSALFSYLHQYQALNPRFVQRTAFSTYIDILDNQIGDYFSQLVSELSDKYNSNDYTGFHDLVVDIGFQNPVMIELSNIVSKYFFASHKVTIGGQVKLHPPGIHDTNSTRWHYDGNPNCLKIIILLDDSIDGNFQYKIPDNSLKNLAFSPLSCISKDDQGFSSLIDAADKPILNPLVKYLPDPGYHSESTLTSFKGSTVFFHGASLLHRGGLNKLKSRPIFQGLVTLS